MIDAFTAADASRVQSCRDESTQRHFDIVLKQCYDRLRYVSRMNQNECLFDVPEYMIGFPPYDQNELVNYVLKKLRNNKYHVTYQCPRFLTISWPKTDTKTDTKVVAKVAAKRVVRQVQKGYIPDRDFELILP